MFGIRREQGRLAELAPLMRLLAGGGAAWRPGLAALLVELDMDDEARAVLARVAADGLEPLRETLWLASLAYLTDASAAVGDEAMAATLYPELAPLEGQNLLIGHVVACHGAADRYLGMLAATLGDARPRPGPLRAGARAQPADGRTDLGRPHRPPLRPGAARGDPRRWPRSRSRAARRGRVARGGHRHARPAPPHRRRGASALPDGLAFRDAHVLALLAAGASTREIGDRVGVSEHEAVQLVRAVLERSGCSSRREAALLAERLGLAGA